MATSDASREITQVVPEAVALKALTHPVRVRMLGMLRIDGPATATQLAQRLDLNSGASSYHLRQLAQHGFIEEDDSRGSKRERWWRAKHESTRFLKEDADEDALAAGLAFAQSALSVQAANAQRSVENYLSLPPEWQRAAAMSDYTMVLTAQEASDLRERLYAVLAEASQQAPPLGGPRPEGAEPYTVQIQAFAQLDRPARRSDAEDES